LGINVSILHRILAVKEKTHILKIIYKEDMDILEIHFLNNDTSIEIIKQDEKQQDENKNDENKKDKKSKSKKEIIHKIIEKTYEKHFEIPLVDIEMDLMEIPQIEYSVEFSLISSNFSNIVSQLKMFGDTMDIECSEEQIILYSHTSESGKMSVEICVDDLTEFSIIEGHELKLSFSLIYLNNICAFNRLTKEIDIKICENYPLCIIYNLLEGASIRFYLAPKNDE
jgi:proliferating cell nuclear antigen PCNA